MHSTWRKDSRGEGDEREGCTVRSGHIIKNSVWHAKELGFYPEGKGKSVKNSK